MLSWQITQIGTSCGGSPPSGTDPLAAFSVVTTADSAVGTLDDSGLTSTHPSIAAAGATPEVAAAPSTAAGAATGASGTTGAAARGTAGATGCGAAGACNTRAGAGGTAELAASTLATTKANYFRVIP